MASESVDERLSKQKQIVKGYPPLHLHICICCRIRMLASLDRGAESLQLSTQSRGCLKGGGGAARSSLAHCLRAPLARDETIVKLGLHLLRLAQPGIELRAHPPVDVSLSGCSCFLPASLIFLLFSFSLSSPSQFYSFAPLIDELRKKDQYEYFRAEYELLQSVLLCRKIFISMSQDFSSNFDINVPTPVQPS